MSNAYSLVPGVFTSASGVYCLVFRVLILVVQCAGPRKSKAQLFTPCTAQSLGVLSLGGLSLGVLSLGGLSLFGVSKSQRFAPAKIKSATFHASPIQQHNAPGLSQLIDSELVGREAFF